MIRDASFQSQQLIKQNEALATSKTCHPCQVINTSYCFIFLVVNPSEVPPNKRCANVNPVELDKMLVSRGEQTKLDKTCLNTQRV